MNYWKYIMYLKFIQVVLLTTVISACSSIPKVLQGEYSNLTPFQAKQKHITMEKVRWSGQIIQVINDNDKTCLLIVNSETDKSLRPKRIIPKNGGRFIACKPDFLEPEVFSNKLVTITGTLSQYTTEKVGEYDYEYPVVSAEKIYIWSHSSFKHLKHRIIIHQGPYFCRYNLKGFCL